MQCIARIKAHKSERLWWEVLIRWKIKAREKKNSFNRLFNPQSWLFYVHSSCFYNASMADFLFKQIQAHLSVFCFPLVSLIIFSMFNTSSVNGICWEPPFPMSPLVSLGSWCTSLWFLGLGNTHSWPFKLIAIQVIGLFEGNEEWATNFQLAANYFCNFVFFCFLSCPPCILAAVGYCGIVLLDTNEEDLCYWPYS